MLTAVFPLTLHGSSFWSSSEGEAVLAVFFRTVSSIPGLDRFVVFAGDDLAMRLAERHTIEAVRDPDPADPTLPRTLEQTVALAERFMAAHDGGLEGLAILDPRDLCFSPKKVEQALLLHGRRDRSCVVSLSPCRDHPCQWVSYYNFIGCDTLAFAETAGTCGKKIGHGDKAVVASVDRKDDAELWSVRVRCDVGQESPLLIQMIPVEHGRPDYAECCELFLEADVSGGAVEQTFSRGEGLIMTVLAVSESGDCDAVEHFTTPAVSWDFDAAENRVVERASRKPIIGRQQFNDVYTFDGGIFLAHADRLEEAVDDEGRHVVTGESCIATDWVDYFEFMAARAGG